MDAVTLLNEGHEPVAARRTVGRTAASREVVLTVRPGVSLGGASGGAAGIPLLVPRARMELIQGATAGATMAPGATGRLSRFAQTAAAGTKSG